MDTEKYFVKEMHMFKDLEELIATVREEEESKENLYYGHLFRTKWEWTIAYSKLYAHIDRTALEVIPQVQVIDLWIICADTNT